MHIYKILLKVIPKTLIAFPNYVVHATKNKYLYVIIHLPIPVISVVSVSIISGATGCGFVWSITVGWICVGVNYPFVNSVPFLKHDVQYHIRWWWVHGFFVIVIIWLELCLWK